MGWTAFSQCSSHYGNKRFMSDAVLYNVGWEMWQPRKADAFMSDAVLYDIGWELWQQQQPIATRRVRFAQKVVIYVY